MSSARLYPKAYSHWLTSPAAALNVALLTSSYSFSPDHSSMQDVYGETSGPGYTAGGQNIPGSVVYDQGLQAVKLTAPDLDWPGASFSARYGLIYLVPSFVPAEQKLVALIDFGATLTADGDTFRLSSPNGLLTLA